MDVFSIHCILNTGKGPNIWDEWTQEGGNVANNDTGNIACNSYELFEEDVALLPEMGVSV